MKKAIVTGANGFIGSALLKVLSENNVEVYAVVKTLAYEAIRADAFTERKALPEE